MKDQEDDLKIPRTKLRWKKPVGISVAVALVLGLLVFLFTPSPQLLCEHIVELRKEQHDRMYDTIVSPLAVGNERRPQGLGFRQTCEWFFNAYRKSSRFGYMEVAWCVRGSNNSGSIFDCTMR